MADEFSSSIDSFPTPMTVIAAKSELSLPDGDAERFNLVRQEVEQLLLAPPHIHNGIVQGHTLVGGSAIDGPRSVGAVGQVGSADSAFFLQVI